MQIVGVAKVEQQCLGYAGLCDGSRDDGHTHEKKEEEKRPADVEAAEKALRWVKDVVALLVSQL